MFADRIAAAQQALDAGNTDQAALIIRSALTEAHRTVESGDAAALAWMLLLTGELEALLGDALGTGRTAAALGLAAHPRAQAQRADRRAVRDVVVGGAALQRGC